MSQERLFFAIFLAPDSGQQIVHAQLLSRLTSEILLIYKNQPHNIT